MRCKDEKDRDMKLSMAMIMQPYQANPSGKIHGGEVMKIMDSVASATVIQYTKGNVVTARVDEMEFMKPVNIGAFITCTGRILYVGRTSVEVAVSVDVENLITHQKKERALTAYFTMVSLDRNDNPMEVPQIIPETDDEIRVFNEIRRRREIFKLKRNK